MLSNACRFHRLSKGFQVLAQRSSRGCSSKAMAAAGTRGAFILFEGVDRSGKSTQARKLVEALEANGVPTELWNFPDRKNTLSGDMINTYLSGSKHVSPQAVHLYFSGNRHEKRDALLEALLSGTTVVVDRYAYSGVAYSAAKGVPGMDMAWCKSSDQGLPAPDLLIYLRANNAVAAAREGFGEERYEKAEFQEKVRAVFEQLREPDWLVQDASQPIEQIHQQVLSAALDAIKRCQESEPIRRLWDHQVLQQTGQQQQRRSTGKCAEAGQSSPIKQPQVLQQQRLERGQ